MHCSRCQHENRPRAKFCEECGASLSRACKSCGAELPAMARFCPECGNPVVAPVVPQPGFASPQSYTPKHLAEKILPSKSALEGERKQVTVLFADLKGSMELLAGRDRQCPLRCDQRAHPPRADHAGADEGRPRPRLDPHEQ